MNWNDIIKKIADKHFRQAVKTMFKYILILAIIFLAYIFLAQYVLKRSEQLIGFTGVYNYSFEIRNNNIRIRFNTLDPTASLVKFRSDGDLVVLAITDYRRFHEHVAALNPDQDYTLTIDIKDQQGKISRFKTQDIETRNIGVIDIKMS